MKNKGVGLIVAEGQLEAIPAMKALMKPGNAYVDIDSRDNRAVRLCESRAFLSTIAIAGEIVSTPGHSNDSVTLVLDSGDAFTGDLQSESRADESMAGTVRASWQKLRALHVAVIHPGHGPARAIPFA